MARKKLLAVAVGMMLPAVAQALTLDQIKVGSLLDQPLKAAIEVTADRQEELDSLRVGLASPRRFTEKGIPRPALLEQLQFQIVRKEAGKAVVVVTTRQPVKEPFLDFLVEATWDSGQVMREYTVLLDPPFTVDRSPPPIAVPAQAEPAKPVAAKTAPPKVAEEKPERQTAAEQPRPAPAQTPPQKPTPKADVAPAGPVAGRIEVAKGDTLWSLAKSVRPAGASVYQTLNAIYLANPDAFLEDNVNLMLEGSILRVPPREEVLALDERAAERLLAEHTRAWRPGTPVSAGDGEGEAEAEAAATERAPTDVGKTAAPKPEAAELRLASAGTGASATDSGAGAEGDAATTASQTDELAAQLVLAREDAAAVRQETQDLRSRLVDLQAQLEDARRLLELKDEQLARLQAYYAAQEEEQAAPESLAGTETVPEDVIAAETIDRGPGPIESGVEDAGPQPPADRTPVAEEESEIPEAAATADAVATAEPVGVPDAAETAAATPPTPDEQAKAPEAQPLTEPEPLAGAAAGAADAVAEPPVDEQPAAGDRPGKADPVPASTGSGVGLDDIPIVPVVGGIAVAGLLGLLLLRRRRRGGGEGPPAVSSAVPAAAPAREAARPSVATQLAEVDDLVAVGDVDGARTLAERLLVSNPGQPQVAFKLFEIHHKAGDATAYGALARKLAATGFAAEYVEVWARVEEMGRELMPGDRLFAPSASAVEAQAVAEERDLDQTLDSFETELRGRDERLREEAAAVLGEAADDLDTNRSLPPVAATAASGAGQPEPTDASPDLEETVKFEKIELGRQDAADGEAPAAGYEGAIEFDLDSLEQPAAAATDTDKASAGEPTRDDDALDTLDFALPATEPEVSGEAIPGNLDDLAESLETIPLTSDVEGEPGGETRSADRNNIVSLRPDEAPASDAAVASDEDEVQTKLDLARAFLDLGDAEGARSILEEVVAEGNERQREEAESLLSNTG